MAENLSEIKKDEKDVEAGSIAACRICLQCDGEEDEGLISPCMCKRTQQFVHRSCLDQWQFVKAGFEFSHCTTCKAQYHLRVVEPEGKLWRKTKFILFVARDVIIVFLALQPFIGMLGGLAYLLNHTYGYLNDLYDNHWDTVISYYCAGLFVLLVLVTLYGMMYRALCWCTNISSTMGPCVTVVRIFFMVMLIIPGCLSGILDAVVADLQRHNQSQLTKEYVVEDLNGCYSTPAEPDPVHMERLKSLELL